jgi:hypothetical protein
MDTNVVNIVETYELDDLWDKSFVVLLTIVSPIMGITAIWSKFV